jgi:hypothetical protein
VLEDDAGLIQGKLRKTTKNFGKDNGVPAEI